VFVPILTWSLVHGFNFKSSTHVGNSLIATGYHGLWQPLFLISELVEEPSMFLDHLWGLLCWKYDKLVPKSNVCSLLLFLPVTLSLTSAIFCLFLMSQIRHLFCCRALPYYFPFLHIHVLYYSRTSDVCTLFCNAEVRLFFSFPIDTYTYCYDRNTVCSYR
jgi:hypothetical protein